MNTLCITALAAVASMTCADMAGAQERTLNYSSWLPTSHWLNTEAMQPWMANVEEATGGEIKINQLPKPVGTPQAQFDVCRDGLADICVVVAGYTPGRFPLAEAGELPFLGDDVTKMAPGFDAFYREHFLKLGEMKGNVPLAVFKLPPGHIFTRDKKVETLADMEGLKLRSPGKVSTKALELMGAVPILKSSTEAYELLAQGVIDGSLMLEESVKSTNSVDLMHFGTLIPGGLFSATLAVVINQQTFDSLSPEQQAALSGVSGAELGALFGQAYQVATEEGRAAYTAAGYEITQADSEFVESLKATLKPLDDEWIAVAEERGVEDGAATLEALREAMQ